MQCSMPADVCMHSHNVPLHYDVALGSSIEICQVQAACGSSTRLFWARNEQVCQRWPPWPWLNAISLLQSAYNISFSILGGISINSRTSILFSICVIRPGLCRWYPRSVWFLRRQKAGRDSEPTSVHVLAVIVFGAKWWPQSGLKPLFGRDTQ